MAAIAFVVFQVVVVDSLFEDDGVFQAWAVTSTLACTAGAALGCGLALRRRGHAAAWSTALLLLTMLLAIFAVVWWSSSTALQSRLYPYALVLALGSPVACRALALTLWEREGVM